MLSSSSSLPEASSPSLALVPATPQEIIECAKLNFSAWAGPLSLESYLQRESFLATQGLTKDGGITTWILVDTSTKNRIILSACESIRKRALLYHNGKLEEVTAHGVASVYCRPEFRGRGYASRLIKELGDKLRTWHHQEAVFAVLYSDIGKKFYTAHGWNPFPSTHISLPAVLNGDRASSTPIFTSNLAEYCRDDENALRKSLSSNSNLSSNTKVALIPDAETMHWHHAREEFLAKELFGRLPDKKGAAVGSAPGERVWCIWTRTFGDNENPHVLRILRMVVEGEDWQSRLGQGNEGNEDRCSQPLAKLQGENRDEKVLKIMTALSEAQAEAQRWNISEVQLWNPSPLTILAAKNIDPSITVVNREETSIASLKWYGVANKLYNSVEWIANEKYGWC
ncbi:MAG: hypothetical protein M1834_005853 [Cirrosporium novae-zelandiae]|nr:MAG: hypothetical protein M1834_005853 [Cirrosporium novae-zelandiae]